MCPPRRGPRGPSPRRHSTLGCPPTRIPSRSCRSPPLRHRGTLLSWLFHVVTTRQDAHAFHRPCRRRPRLVLERFERIDDGSSAADPPSRTFPRLTFLLERPSRVLAIAGSVGKRVSPAGKAHNPPWPRMDGRNRSNSTRTPVPPRRRSIGCGQYPPIPDRGPEWPPHVVSPRAADSRSRGRGHPPARPDSTADSLRRVLQRVFSATARQMRAPRRRTVAEPRRRSDPVALLGPFARLARPLDCRSSR
jgi:hypothetical protein